jgi:hypothetical protein
MPSSGRVVEVQVYNPCDRKAQERRMNMKF